MRRRIKVTIQTYRDLNAWKKSMDLVTEVYQLTKQLPQEEIFGLTSQARRAVISIPANIAEGHGRLHLADYRRHLSIARGSLMEVETHLLIAVRLHYLKPEQTNKTWDTLQAVGRLLNGLIRSIEQKMKQSHQPEATAKRMKPNP
jgi:four helix bundle protein